MLTIESVVRYQRMNHPRDNPLRLDWKSRYIFGNLYERYGNKYSLDFYYKKLLWLYSEPLEVVDRELYGSDMMM